MLSEKGASARQKNQARRKLKELNNSQEVVGGGLTKAPTLGGASSASAGPSKAVVTEQSQQNGDKIVVESVVDIDRAFEDANEWPFERFCDELCNELFEPKWEVRHGAAVALREILKRHASSAGKRSDALSLEQQASRSHAWLIDCCLRLVCVLILDRFADFGGDETVAPVRETAAQALATLYPHMTQSDLTKLVERFESLLHQRENWEVRHSVFLALKYMVSVRQDIIEPLLPRLLLPRFLEGLSDPADDVRLAAADSLLQLARNDPKCTLIPAERVDQIASVIWTILLELDDITSSTTSLMHLLAELYATRSPPPQVTLPGASASLEVLVPRLFPFFRHAVKSVRVATLRTVMKLLSTATSSSSSSNASVAWLGPIHAKMLEMIFQNAFLEENEDIVSLSLQLWRQIVPLAAPFLNVAATQALVTKWFQIAATPNGAAFRRGDNVKPGVVDNQTANAATRIASATFLAGIAYQLCVATPQPDISNTIWSQIHTMLSATSASLRQTAALVLVELAKSFPPNSVTATPSTTLPDALKQLLLQILELRTATGNYYSELQKPLNDIYADVESLLQSFRNIGIPLSLAIPVAQMTMQQIQEIIGAGGFDALIEYVPADSQPTPAAAPATGKKQQKAEAREPTVREQLCARRDRIRTAINLLEAVQAELTIQVSDAISAAVVSMGLIPEKLSPLINSHLKALKRESDVLLQNRCAESLALLMYQIRPGVRNPSPNPAILKQVLVLLQGDLADLVPTIEKEEDEEDKKQQGSTEPPAAKRRKPNEDSTPPTPTNAAAAAVSTPPVDPAVSAEARTGRRGAEAVLKSLCDRFGAQLFEYIPSLLADIQNNLAVAPNPTVEDSHVISLMTIRGLAPHLDASLQGTLRSLIPVVISHVAKQTQRRPQAVAARTLATVVKSTMPESMNVFLEMLLPVLQDASSSQARYGAAMSLHYLIDELGIDVLPYIIFLIIPILGRMSDQDDSVRRTVTFCFATLVKLLPLEAAIPSPPSMSAELIATRERERRFLQQLIGGGPKVDRFELPIKIKATLRSYQQEGVNWLSFLNRYNLHGVLADDMGLGKTLQTLCVVASDDFQRKEKFKADPIKNADSRPLPSLVVCPPTLIGHWAQEVRTYCDPTEFKVLEYTGTTVERRPLISTFQQYQLVVMSYDVVRNDIDYLNNIPFNYCVLDEGHIIRNSKTKLTRAVKQVKANHRLLLSGTPIQNSVLELWSLFDFLMPGFLGTEKQFIALYSKPIVASRDPRATSQDQERGVLAMEALHRQVLPFVLRRLKEDVLQDLPPKIIQDVSVDLSPLQVKLYELASSAHIESDVADDSDTKAAPGKSKHIFQALQYLRKLCSHPKLVLNPSLPEYKAIMSELKPGALEDFYIAPKLVALRDLLLECGIGINEEAVSKTAPGMHHHANDAFNVDVSQHRVLIFCQLKQMIDIIEEDLFKKHMKTVTYMRLDGDVPQAQRVPLVEKFNSNPTIDVLMLTGRVGGLGLNLTGADTVIFMEHDWNPQADLQAMDRAHRLGAKKTVNVYRIITKGTLEEKIMSLQQFKLRIANTVVNKDNQSFANMDTSQLLDLFNYSGPVGGASEKKNTAIKAKTPAKKDAAGTAAVESAGGHVPGLPKAIMANLDELWDESQYAEEYNIDSFLKTLKN